MADKSFGVKDINLIGASGTPTIESPNNLNINAVNVAISTDITVAGKVSLGAGTSISSPAANVLTLGTNSVERVRIDSSGQSTFDKGAPGSANQVIARFQAESSRQLDVVWHDTGSLMGFDTPSNHAYIFKTNGTERMRITASGLITTPYQPAFRAVDGSGITLTAGSPAVFDSTSTTGGFNRGSHYSTSNGRFTAPIAGVYQFQASLGTNGWSSGNTSQDHFTLRVNNNAYVYSIKRENIDSANSANGYFTDYASFTVNLSANDYVTVVPNYNNNSFGNSSYTWFEGFFIG